MVILAPYIHANIDHFAQHAQLAHQIFILQQAVFSFKKSFLKISYLHSPAAREKLDFVSWEIQYLRNTWFSFHIQVPICTFWVNWNKGSFVIFWSSKERITTFFSQNIPKFDCGCFSRFLSLWCSWLLLYVLCKLRGTLICHHCNIKLWRLSISFCSIIFGYPKLIVCVRRRKLKVATPCMTYWKHQQNSFQLFQKCIHCGFS